MPMPMSFADMYGRVQNFIQDDSSDTLTIIKDALNQEYKRLATGADWPELRGMLNEDITLVADQGYLALPGDAAHVISISDKERDITFLNLSHPRNVEDHIDRIGTSGSPVYFSELGLRATKAPMSADDQARVLAEDSGDTSIEVRLQVLRSSPEIRQIESITTDAGDGTTPVNGTVSIRKGWSIDAIGTNTAPSNGYVRITEKTDTTKILAEIAKGEKQTQYYVVHFSQPPDTANDLTVLYKKRISPLADDDDVPIVPIGEAVVEACIAKLRQYDEQYTQAEIHRRDSDALVASALSERRLQKPQLKQLRPDVRQRGLRRVARY